MKNSIRIPITCLILLLGLLLNGACSPFAPAKQASSPIVAEIEGVVQPPLATPTPLTSPSQPEDASSAVHSVAASESEAIQSDEDELDINPETSFPLAPNTRFDPGNGDSGEVESGGAFSLHSTASVETINQFYQSALPIEGWQLRYIDANHMGGVTQYWKYDMVYMSLDLAYDNTGLGIQARWHQVDREYVQMLPAVIPLPDKAELFDATDSTWEVYILQDMKAVSGYYQQKAAALKWTPRSVPAVTGPVCSGDCLNQAAPAFPPGVTPMPAPTPDPRQPQTLAYTMTDGNEIIFVFRPHQGSTILDITLTLKNVESAGLPRELLISPEAADLVIAPGMVRFTVPTDVQATAQYYIDVMTHAGWNANAGYSLDTPELYFQQWDKGEQALRINISSSASSSGSSMVSFQCIQCTPP